MTSPVGKDLGQLYQSATNPYATDAQRNPYGVGIRIVAGGQGEDDDDVASSADSPTFLPKPLPALKAPNAGTDPSD